MCRAHMWDLSLYERKLLHTRSIEKFYLLCVLCNSQKEKKEKERGLLVNNCFTFMLGHYSYKSLVREGLEH